MGPPGKPAASAPARPGSPAPIASGLLRPTPPNPPRQLPIQSPAATPPWAQSLFFRIKRQATSHLRKKESCAYDLFQGIDELGASEPSPNRRCLSKCGEPLSVVRIRCRSSWDRAPPRQSRISADGSCVEPPSDEENWCPRWLSFWKRRIGPAAFRPCARL